MDKNDRRLIIRNSNLRRFIIISSIPISTIFLSIQNRDFNDRESLLSFIFLTILEYFLSLIFLNYYNFYENYVEIYYPTRFWKGKRKKIMYSNIKKVEYGESYGDGAYVRIYQIGEKTDTLITSSNSFSSTSFQRTRKTLKFLQSKGIPIEIVSTRKKRLRILT